MGGGRGGAEGEERRKHRGRNERQNETKTKENSDEGGDVGKGMGGGRGWKGRNGNTKRERGIGEASKRGGKKSRGNESEMGTETGEVEQ